MSRSLVESLTDEKLALMHNIYTTDILEANVSVDEDNDGRTTKDTNLRHNVERINDKTSEEGEFTGSSTQSSDALHSGSGYTNDHRIFSCDIDSVEVMCSEPSYSDTLMLGMLSLLSGGENVGSLRSIEHWNLSVVSDSWICHLFYSSPFKFLHGKRAWSFPSAAICCFGIVATSLGIENIRRIFIRLDAYRRDETKAVHDVGLVNFCRL